MSRPQSLHATQPMDILLIRHGQSEANIVQHGEKNDQDVGELAELVYSRLDFEHHLTALGVRQAKAARAVLLGAGIAPESYFDEHYVSPYIRTQETFAYITDGKVNPLPEVRLIERDWGLYGAVPMSERIARFADTERRREKSSFYTRYETGQNIPDVILHTRNWLSTLNREKTNQKVMAVVHGEEMWSARYVLEGMSPEQWHEADLDKAQRIGNCCLLWYTRMDPEGSGRISRTMTGGWRLMFDPYEPDKSPFNGDWVKLSGRTRYVGADMLAAAETYQRFEEMANETQAAV